MSTKKQTRARIIILATMIVVLVILWRVCPTEQLVESDLLQSPVQETPQQVNTGEDKSSPVNIESSEKDAESDKAPQETFVQAYETANGVVAKCFAITETEKSNAPANIFVVRARGGDELTVAQELFALVNEHIETWELTEEEKAEYLTQCSFTYSNDYGLLITNERYYYLVSEFVNATEDETVLDTEDLIARLQQAIKE